MASKVATQDAAPKDPSRALETVLIEGDLSVLSPDERIRYYHAVCDSMGLNPLTKPFEYIRLNNRLVLYALRNCTDQLRKIHKISIRLMDTRTLDGVYVVTAQATDASGREDTSTGAVNIKGLAGETLANGYMRAETKAKRRATLSICGLSTLDETELPLEASTRAATRAVPVSRKPADDLADFAGEHPPKQIAEPPPPAHDAETGEIVDTDEYPHRIALAIAEGVADWQGWCSDMKDALLSTEDEDTLLAIMEQNKTTMATLAAGGKGGRDAADRLRTVFTGCQLELRRKAAAA
jgi:hypothetical protein